MDRPEIDASVLHAPGARQMAAWTLRLMADELFCRLFFSDAHLFALGYASCATAIDPPRISATASSRGQGALYGRRWVSASNIPGRAS
jgi:hypothetical protein